MVAVSSFYFEADMVSVLQGRTRAQCWVLRTGRPPSIEIVAVAANN